MNKLATELVDLRKDVCEVLVNVGESLIRDPQHLRPLKLFAERLDGSSLFCMGKLIY